MGPRHLHMLQMVRRKSPVREVTSTLIQTTSSASPSFNLRQQLSKPNYWETNSHCRNKHLLPRNEPAPPFWTLTVSIHHNVSQERYCSPSPLWRSLTNTASTDAFPSSEAFEAINSALASSDAERKDAIKKGQAVFAFTLKNKAGETAEWHIDLKEKGVVGTGLGDKPTGKI